MPRTKTGRGANGSGSIRKKTVTRNGKPYTYWEARYTEGFDQGTGKQIQRSITGRTQKEVAEKLREVTASIDHKTYTPPSKLTLNEWLEIWVRDYLPDIKPSTCLLYQKNIALYIAPYLGSVKLTALSSPMVQNLYKELHTPTKANKAPLSPKTIKNVHGILHKALQQAVQIGCLTVNPTDACKLPRAESKKSRSMEETQIAAFLSAIENHTHEYLYKITLFTGLREGEVLGLTWDCLDLECGTLLVKQQLCREQKRAASIISRHPKNGKHRILTLAPSVIRLFRCQELKQKGMKMLAGDAWTENNMVFTNRTGGYLSYRTVYDCFKRIAKKIDAPTMTFHGLRHTYATMAIKKGDDIKTVQENLGHATATFTLDVYGHVTGQMRQNSAARMEEFIQQISAG